jgi:hypothetical protein
VLGHVLDDQDLEVRAVVAAVLHRMGGVVQGIVFGAQVPGVAAAVGVGGQRPVDPPHQHGEPVVLARREQPPHLLEGRHAGEGPEPLDGAEEVEQPGDGLVQVLDRTVLGRGQQQLARCLLQAAPGVVPDLPRAVVRRLARAFRHRDHLRRAPGFVTTAYQSRCPSRVMVNKGA